MDINTIQAIADSKLSFLFGILVFVWAGMTKRIVWGWYAVEQAADLRLQLTEMRTDRDKAKAECKEYQDLAKEAAFNTRTSIATLEKTVDQLRSAREGR